MAAAVVVLTISLCAPALAATSVTAPDGTVVRVWQAVALAAPGDPGSHGVLAYSVTGGSGTTVGTIDASGRAAVGDDAALTLDPATGNPVVVWSRHDGVAFRIAYARLVAGAWVDIHDLTFGTGDASLPRVGSGRSGAWLFWVADGNQYLYAPIELSIGRLFAAPQPLITGHTSGARAEATVRPGADGLLVGASSGGSTCGGQDCPVVLPAGHGRGSKATRWNTPASRPKNASDATLEGNIDAPVILGLDTWDVVSSLDCRSLILVVPDGLEAMLLRFRDGIVSAVGRGRIPAPQPLDGLATTLASPRLQLLCD